MIFTRENWQAVKESPNWVLWVAAIFFGGLTLMAFFVTSDPLEIIGGVIAFGAFCIAAIIELILRLRRHRNSELMLQVDAEVEYTPNKSLEQPGHE